MVLPYCKRDDGIFLAWTFWNATVMKQRRETFEENEVYILFRVCLHVLTAQQGSCMQKAGAVLM